MTTTRDDYDNFELDNGQVVGPIYMNNFRDKSSNSNPMAFNGDIDYEVVDEPSFLCNYCLKDCPMSTIFHVNGCGHFFCSDCVAKYVAHMLERNIINIRVCLRSKCVVKLEPQHCRSILPRQVFDRWTNALYRRGDVEVRDSDFRVERSNSNCVASNREIHYDSHDDADGCVISSKTNVFDRRVNDYVVDGNPKFTCDICADEKPLTVVFHVLGCDHSYCSDCVVMYVATKLQENVSNIQCPDTGCDGKLELQHCRSILPPEVFDKWGDSLCEAMISPSERFYCPFKDCSALLIKDVAVTMQSECPNCRRLFCADCQVPWHSNLSCKEYMILEKGKKEKENDMRLIKLAEENKWQRCPKCEFYVELTEGCQYMTCRCNCKFCYLCGAVAYLKERHPCRPWVRRPC